jgi:hypothetical protein
MWVILYRPAKRQYGNRLVGFIKQYMPSETNDSINLKQLDSASNYSKKNEILHQIPFLSFGCFNFSIPINIL